MEITFKIKDDYNSLDKLLNYVKPKTNYTCTKTDNTWEDFTIKFDKCVLIKKNTFYAIKVDFVNKNTIKLEPVIPSSYFRNFAKGRGFTPIITNLLISGKQKSMLNEVTKYFSAITN